MRSIFAAILASCAIPAVAADLESSYAEFDALTRSGTGEWRAMSALDGCTLFFRGLSMKDDTNPSGDNGNLYHSVVDISAIGRVRPQGNTLIVLASGDVFPVVSHLWSGDGYDRVTYALPATLPPRAEWETYVASEALLARDFPEGELYVDREASVRLHLLGAPSAEMRTLWRVFERMVAACRPAD